MSENKTEKNYAATRYSGTYGEGGRCLSLKFNKTEIIEWFKAMTPDEKGNVRISIAPRKTPSEANKFSVFQDTWKPDFSKAKARSLDVRVATSSLPKEPLSAGEAEDIPF